MIGVVYKLKCNKTEMVYYGSTNNYNNRIRKHINMVKTKRGYYQTMSYLIIQEGDYAFEVLETLHDCSKETLEQRERFYIENNKCINRRCPLRKSNEPYLCECGRQLFINNRCAHIKTKQHLDFVENGIKYVKPTRTYEEYKNDKINCDCGGKYTPKRKAGHFKTKQHLDFVENGIKYVKPTRTNAESKNDKINCDCGGKYILANKAEHFKTKRHQKFII